MCFNFKPVKFNFFVSVVSNPYFSCFLVALGHDFQHPFVACWDLVSLILKGLKRENSQHAKKMKQVKQG